MVTKQICDFLTTTHFSGLPGEAVRLAKMAIMDMLGTALAATPDPGARIIIDYVNASGGMPEASVIGSTRKIPPALAALANGTLGHVLDYDDASYTTIGHPTVAILPGILALAEKHALSGKAVLEAYILGFEVAAKIGLGLGFDGYRAGWHCTSTIGVMGAAAALAKLLRFGLDETARTLGIAASLSCGIRQNFGTMTKALHAGIAAHNAVMAALLAGNGFSSDKNILEAPLGYGRIFAPHKTAFEIPQNLGDPFDIVSHGLSFKPYPSCRFTHHLIDATLHLVATHQLQPEDIAQVDCRISPVVLQVLIHHQPKSALEAKFSLEYCVARAIIDREVLLDHFADERILDPQVQDLMTRIRYTLLDEKNMTFGKGGTMPPAGVNITLYNGTELSHMVHTPKGDPGNPMSLDELVLKFRDCAYRALPSTRVNRCIDTLMNLEALENIRMLMKALTPA